MPGTGLLVAPAPVQLTFDRFVIGPESQFAASAAKMLSRSGRPRYNPLVLRGVEGVGKSLLLDAMRGECARVAPAMRVTVLRSADLRLAATVDGLLEPELVLLDEPAGLAGRPLNQLKALLGERVAAGRLTIVALDAGRGQLLLELCRRSFPEGLSAELMPPSADTRREILLRHMREHDINVEEAASAALTFIPWETAGDVEALGEQLVQAAYSQGATLTPATVRRLCESLGRRGMGSFAAAADVPCCRHRLRVRLSPGRWPADASDAVSPDETKIEVFRYHCRSVELRMRRWPDRLLLELRADHEGRVPSRFELELRLTPRYSLKIRSGDGWAPQPWGLTAGLPRVDDDPFRAANHWVFCALVPRSPRGARGKRHAEQGGLSDTMRAVRAAIRDVAVCAAAILDPAARRTALRFPNHMRGWVYARVAEDQTGRLAQLAVTCPGALTFAYALSVLGRRAGTHAAANQLLRDVAEGRALNQVLDDALRAWAAGAGRLVNSRHPSEKQRLIWQRLADAGAHEKHAILRAQRLLVRRASAGVPSYTLWLPPPLCFAPEDIPAGKLANARWFRLVKGHAATLVPPSNHDLYSGADFASFVSRHAGAVAAHRKGRFSALWVRSQIQQMLDYAAAMDDYPQRGTSPGRYLAAVDTWHTRMAELERVADAAQIVDGPMVDAEGKALPFPEPPCPGWRSNGDDISPIRSAEEVLVEGTRMKNCVASRIPDLVAGKSALYHGDVCGKGLTIQVESSPWGYRLVEAKRRGNDEPTAAQYRVLGDFLRHFGSDGKCGCGIGRDSAPG
jgi:hypothetical protein